MTRSTIFVATLVIGAVLGCSRSEMPARAPAAANPVPAPEAPASPSHSVINITPEIRSACGISDSEAHFAFDSANVQASDHTTLDKLVLCFTSGPLAKREMRLVGHADPRGGEEYNLALGGSRADSIKSFLVERGLQREQAATTSRGEMDASGTNESSWALDRRVDVLLAN